MKHLRIMLVTILLGSMLFTPTATLAQTIGGPYKAGFQVQNLESTTATISLLFYDQSGATVANVTGETINGNASKTYYPLENAPTNISGSFNGSVVISSDKQVAAIANVLTSAETGGASYSGFTGGATTVSLPLLFKNVDLGGGTFLNSWFNVQNAGSTTATAFVTYVASPASGGAAPGGCPENQSIAMGAAKTFAQADNTCLGNNFIGAATITSTQPMVATVMQIRNTSADILAYNGFTSGDTSTTPVVPLVATNFFGSITGVQIQNTGATSTDITVAYSPSPTFPGNQCQETKTIAGGSSSTFFLPFPAACGGPDPVYGGSPNNNGFVGSAKVVANTANMPLVAIVNQINTGDKDSSAYNAFNPAAGKSKVSLPLILRYGNLFTGIAVANVGTQATNISCTFTGSSYTVSANNVQPGGALTASQGDASASALGSTYVGGATCTATGGDAKIVGVVNQLNADLPGTSDALLTYEGFGF